MKNQKTRGSYYTPVYLSNFILKHSLHHFKRLDRINILEPSVGDGIFIESLISLKDLGQKKIALTAIEKYVLELRKAKERSKKCTNISFKFLHGDFLKLQESVTSKFQLIVGNPPFIKKHRLNKVQRDICDKIHSVSGLDKKSQKNIWSAFLIRCSQLLDHNGVLAFVLPSDLLQAKFSKEIRDFLIEQFNRVEIFTFNELLFKDIGQDTILIFCFKDADEKGVFYSFINNVDSLKAKNYSLSRNISLTSSGTKWTHHFLSEEEISLLFRLKSQLKSIDDFCFSKPGIVTAANDYFIINSEVEKKYELTKYCKDIIQKGSLVNGKLVFTTPDLGALAAQNKPTKVICFSDADIPKFTTNNKEYLSIGKQREINIRFKCALRKNWFVIPNIGKPPDGFFFKRCNTYPKILLNNANVLVTDSAYKIEMKNNYDINSLVFSFYNSLTLAFAELEGRYYGDGVLELTPSEFKKLPIPFFNINKYKFNIFEKEFSLKEKIEDILSKYDEEILIPALSLTVEELEKIRIIRRKLINKRLRNYI